LAPDLFADKSNKPDDRQLAGALGKTYQHWAEIKRHVAAEYGQPVEEWKYYGAKYGWTLKTLHKKRNLFFFKPRERFFSISFVFGDRAVALIEKSGLPDEMIKEIKNAKRYAEGRGLRIEVKTKRDVESVKKLIAIKVAA
jgi:hypothetical protein